jgi:hypothetical protein
MAKPNEFANTLMSEVVITAAKAGWEPKDFSDLAQNEEVMKLVLGVLRSTHEIKGIEHVIDCNDEPMIPNGWSVERHQNNGVIKFDISKTELYLSKKQKSETIEGHKLCEELKDKKVLNANVLDYLLANPKTIPEEWKGKAVFFWGTIYRNSGGGLCVRCLCWFGGRWRWDFYWLDFDFGSDNPALLFAS